MPIPGTPTSVTSCGERSSRTRSSASRTTPSSRSRPTSARARLERDVDAEARPRLQRLPDRDRLLFSFCRDRLGLAVLDRVPRRPVGALADEDPVHGGGALQPRGRVDDVAGGHPLALGRARVERDERLAGVDGDPHLEPLFFSDPVANREGGPDGALGVVLVRERRPEERHHRVADELLHRPAEVLELPAQPRVIRREQLAHVLRIHPLGPRREPNEVGEEDGDDLPLLPPGCRRRAASATPHSEQNFAPGWFEWPQA